MESWRVNGGGWFEGSGDTERRFRNGSLYLLEYSNDGSTTTDCNGGRGMVAVTLGLLVTVDLEMMGERGQLSSETLRPLESSPYMVARRGSEPSNIFQVSTAKSAVSAATTGRQTFGDRQFPEVGVYDGCLS